MLLKQERQEEMENQYQKSSRNSQKCPNYKHFCEQTSSKYFKSTAIIPETCSSPDTTNLPEKPEETYVEVECPYKSFICNTDTIKGDVTAADDDFETPKPIIKRPCLYPSSTKVTVKRKRTQTHKKKTRQTTLSKSVFSLPTYDVNPEHLQMAIALSRSEQEEVETNEGRIIDPSKPTIAQSLEQFGFVTGRSKLSVRDRRLFCEKKKKTSRYGHITPELLIRTETERQELISVKVSSILKNSRAYIVKNNPTNNYDGILLSNTLKKYWNKTADIFNIAGTYSCSIQNNSVFYIKGMPLTSLSRTKCSSLLRNWSTIPGRMLSPTSKNFSSNCSTEIEDSAAMKCDNVNAYQCVSPDLFESDDEYLAEMKASALKDSFSQCNNISSSNTQTVIDEGLESCSISYSLPKNTSQNCHGVPMEPQSSNVALELTPSKLLQNAPRETVSTHNYRSSSEVDLHNNHLDFRYRGNDTLDLIHLSDEEVNTKKSVSRRSSMLNVTDYIYSVLNEKQETIDEDVVDLTQSSPEHLLDVETNENDDTVLYNLSPTLSPTVGNFSFATQVTIGSDDLHILTPTNFHISEALPSVPLESTTAHTPVEEDIETLANDHNIKLGYSDQSHEVTPTKNVIIKTSNITPMMNYAEMTTPTIHRELIRFGLKPFKRRRGVQLLQHIYEMTHPIGNQMTILSDDEDEREVKKQRCENTSKSKRSIKKYKSEPCIKATLPQKLIFEKNLEVVPEVLSEFNYIGGQDIEIIENWNVEVDQDELIFETTQSKKIHSCRVPFHIVFHNMVSANPKLREKILLYEPIKLADIHKNLQELGFKFAIKDVENFLHKKCITIKTQQGNASGRHKKR